MRWPSSCQTCRKRISRSGAGKPPGSPSQSALSSKGSSRRPPEGGRAETSGDARSDAGTDLWKKATCRRRGWTKLRAVLAVDLAPYASAERRCVPRELASARQPRSRSRFSIFAPNWKRSGATPSISRRRSRRRSRPTSAPAARPARRKSRAARTASEAFDAWAMTSFTEDLFGRGKTIFCGLPLFHVNGQLVTGLAPWSKGGHVVMAHPGGLSRQRRDREFLGAGRALPHHHVLGRPDRLFGAPGDADRRTEHREPGSGDLRRGADARATLPGVPARDRAFVFSKATA